MDPTIHTDQKEAALLMKEYRALAPAAEKIRTLTGLDLREFEHAITFKVALMVQKYLTSKPTKF